MSIIDPSIIAFLQNYKEAQHGNGCKPERSVGSVLVDSLCRSMMTAPVQELAAA